MKKKFFQNLTLKCYYQDEYITKMAQTKSIMTKINFHFFVKLDIAISSKRFYNLTEKN